MKKVLILAYDYPPLVSVGGLRPYSWFKYMSEYGVFPIVITRQWGNKYGNHLDYIAPGDSSENVVETSEKGIIFRTPYSPNFPNRLLIKHGDSKYKFLRKGISAFYEFAQFSFLIGPKLNIYLAAEEYLSANKVDAIIATGEPYVLFEYAARLGKKYSIPWIADYRDPWTQDNDRKLKGFPKTLDAHYEKKILSSVSTITTVSDFFRQQIKSLIPDKPIYIVSNGYDPEAIEKVKDVRQSKEKLNIALGGTIYKWHPVESFLRVSSEFVNSFSRIPDFIINFYGINTGEEIKQLIDTKYQNLKSVVKIHPKIPNEQFLERLAANNIFLLFNYYSYVGTKIYDYLALKRQIILCYDDDEGANELREKYYNMEEKELENEQMQKEVINKTNSGVVVKDADHLKKVLNDFYSEFKANGFIACDSIDTEQYSRKIQVKNLVEIINATLNTTPA